MHVLLLNASFMYIFNLLKKKKITILSTETYSLWWHYFQVNEDNVCIRISLKYQKKIVSIGKVKC